MHKTLYLPGINHHRVIDNLVADNYGKFNEEPSSFRKPIAHYCSTIRRVYLYAINYYRPTDYMRADIRKVNNTETWNKESSTFCLHIAIIAP